ncbi:uncharacterized protein L201_005901 [Kwoniella dendrophila CBS 6074]|uniref:Uncharacterized protein n=1 Tax=Kwoniella dendrophila CBS 6074 TaxID=1295534 RepID=A0AAX4K1L5_9TREE
MPPNWIGDDFPIEPHSYTFPEDWFINWNIKHITMSLYDYEGPDDPELPEVLQSFYETWTKNKGLFKLHIDEMVLQFKKPIRGLYEALRQVHERSCNVPRIIKLSPWENDSGFRINDIIQQMSSMTEQIEIIRLRSVSYIHTTVYEFFESQIDWTAPNAKLRKLDLILNVDSEAYLNEKEFKSNHIGPSNKLQHFGITLDISSMIEQGKIDHLANYILEIEQIAKAMFSVGGMNCHYSLKVISNKNEQAGSGFLNGQLQKEIRGIRQGDRRVQGWRQLSVSERKETSQLQQYKSQFIYKDYGRATDNLSSDARRLQPIDL